MNDLISMRCPHCGGEVKVTKQDVKLDFVIEDGLYSYRGATQGQETIQCLHCKTKFERGQDIKPYRMSMTIETNGGAYIGGTVITNGGDFVGRDKTVVTTVFAQDGQKVNGHQINVSVGAGSRGVAIGRSIDQSVIVTGDDVIIARKNK